MCRPHQNKSSYLRVIQHIQTKQHKKKQTKKQSKEK